MIRFVSYGLLYSHSFALSFPLWQKEKEVNDKKEEKKAKAKAEESKEENQSENGETKTNEVKKLNNNIYTHTHTSVYLKSYIHFITVTIKQPLLG